jgi:HK97 family phage prohead protease
MPDILLNRIPDTYEVRSFADDLRMDAEIGTFDGHASVFDAVDSYRTAFDRKAFNKTLADKEGRIPVLFFHEPKEMIGPAQTLKPDKIGLYHQSKAIEDGRTGSYVLAHLRGGTPMGMSFGFKTRKDRAAKDDDRIDLTTAPEGTTVADVRVITEVEMFEISVLPWVFTSQPKADISNVRAAHTDYLITDHLSTLLESIRGGTLTNEQVVQIEHLVSAWGEREQAGAVETHSTSDDRAKRDRDIQIVIATLKAQSFITGAHP